MNLMVLYQDNGQIKMGMSVITFGLLNQNTHEQWSMVNGETHDKNRCSYYLCFLYYLYVCNGWFCMNKKEKQQERLNAIR
mgnify:CR=1 FL=1